MTARNRHAGGRPSGRQRRDVYLRLMHVAERSLETDSFEGITVRGIAAGAGVSAAMINYYFGGKLGLFSAVVRFVFLEWKRGLASIEAALPDRTVDPVEALACLIENSFYRHSGVIRMVREEHRRPGSPIREHFRTQLMSRNAAALRSMIAAGIAAGRLDPAIHVRYTGYLISMLAVHPAAIGNDLTASYAIDPAELATVEWRAFIRCVLGSALPVAGVKA